MHNSVQNVFDTLALEDGAKRYSKDASYKHKHQLFSPFEWPLFKRAYPLVEKALISSMNTEGAGRKRAFDWKAVVREVSQVLNSDGTPKKTKEDEPVYNYSNVTYIGLQVSFYKAIERKSDTDVATDIGKMVYAQLKETPEHKSEVELGLEILECVLVSGLFQMVEPEGRGFRTLEFTDESIREMHDLEEWQRYMNPIYRPMVAKPKSITEGSYYDERLASTVRMVKTSDKQQKAMLAAAVQHGAKFIEACNAIQSVPLKINTWVMDIIDKAYRAGISVGSVPINKLPEGNSRDERTLRSQLRSQQAGFLQDINEAKEFSRFEEVFLPATMDFRGRVYAKPHLNHQRADYVKALWMFAEGKPLTYAGLEHLKIHLANTGDFQKMSKAPLASRVQWVDDNFPRIYEMVQDPWSDLWWTEADSPFCFLAACKEYVDWFENPEGHISHLPCAIDGSCSGLQHYSAQLRDSVGAKSVNLVPMPEPQDVYAEVAAIVNELVLADKDDPIAQEWLAHKIDRKVTKRATMTLCYSSQKWGWKDQLMADFMDQYSKEIMLGQRQGHPFSEPAKASLYMANKLDIALRMTVKAAMEGMNWIQNTVSLLAKENKPMAWTTPTGFPVVNAYYEPILKRIDIKVRGRRYQNQLLLGYKDKLKASKCRSACAPNVIHAYDACHLQLVALQAKKEGINSFLLIHDSFGCLASDMERFSEIVREQFVELYKNHDPFMSFYENALIALSEKNREKLTLPPAKGSLDIEDVVNSKYAFA